MTDDEFIEVTKAENPLLWNMPRDQILAYAKFRISCGKPPGSKAKGAAAPTTGDQS